jgi:hypothetical protein
VTWLVACQDADPEARWIAAGLTERGLTPCHVVTASEIVHSTAWTHRLNDRFVSSRLERADGTVVDSADVRGVVNRLFWITADGYRGASLADREYGTAEWGALVLSWLFTYGDRVLNRPSAAGLSGAIRSTAHWRMLAHAAGLPAAPYPADGIEPGTPSARPPFAIWAAVVGETVLGGDQLSVTTRQLLPRLGVIGGLDMFEAVFIGEPAHPVLHTVSPLPRLARFGDDAVDCLSTVLEKALARQ